ncbi:MAG: xanthine dehydrogenase family protein molybdopterin-binding subunit [Alphaproteobacteria bacterium]|nr:xanthine dehydrogenase family protein molybdopterin-binding subunit [Alphaproteobacteria bacterium]
MTLPPIDRRRFLVGAAAFGGGLLIGFHLPAGAQEQNTGRPKDFNSWLRIAADGTVSVLVPQSEMGQGVHTALAMLVAEELEADWRRVRVEDVNGDATYRNTFLVKEMLTGGATDEDPSIFSSTLGRLAGWIGRFAGQQVTGGSTSLRWLHLPLRQAGAAAREMLIAAAARRLGVPAGECRAANGAVLHEASGRRLEFGALAAEAAILAPPERIQLKPPSEFRLIGKAVPRLDTPDKVTGQARFGIDMRLEGQLFAAIAFAPTFGASLARLDPAPALSLRGVVAVVPMKEAFAVVADNWWRARRAIDALAPVWTPGPNEALDSIEIGKLMLAQLGDSGSVVHEQGQPGQAIQAGRRHVEAEYRVPYLAHATMEPMNCLARVGADLVEVWAPTQAQDGARKAAAEAAGVALDRVRLRTTYLGGGFGRRSESDFVSHAISVAKAVPGRPVLLLYSREDDMRRDFYRPAAATRIMATIGADGLPSAWTQKIVCPSILARVFPPITWTGTDGTAVEGAVDLPYDIPHQRIEYVRDHTPVPVGFWRSVGHSQNAFFKECFIDEIAEAARLDPLALRRRLLGHLPRHFAVLERAGAMAGWGAALPSRRGRGIAMHASFGSIVAQVAEVAVSRRGEVRIERVCCAVDCGNVVNPDTVVAQMEGSIVFGLAAAMHGEITLAKGRIEQGNFPDYPLLDLAAMPEIEVAIIRSGAPIGGIGEPAVPPVAPALVNAIFAATGKRLRSLPVARHDLAA